MTPRQNFFAYFEDLAKRNVAINHRPASESTRRFFVENAEDTLLGASVPNNTGWNLVLLPFHGRIKDNGATYRPILPRLVFQVLKHVPQQDQDSLHAVFNEAFDIGSELILRIRKHAEQCNLGGDAAITHLSAGIDHPRNIDLTNVGFDEVGPRFDNFFGYVFQAELILDKNVAMEPDDDNWQEPA